MTATTNTYNKKASWILYDFANSSYALVVMTLFFPIYFTTYLAPGDAREAYWGGAIAISILLVAVISPVIGRYVDVKSRRVVAFRFTVIVASIATLLLGIDYTAHPMVGALAFIFVNTIFGISLFLYDTLVLDVSAERKNYTRLSGVGWAVGYIGGPLCLLLIYGLLGNALPVDSVDFRGAFVITAGFFFVFSLPAVFLIRREMPHRGETGRFEFRQIWKTIVDWREHREIFQFLVAMYFVMDAVITIIYFISIFGKNELNLSLYEIVYFLIFVQLVAVPATILISRWADRGREITTLCLSVLGWLVVIGFLYLSGTRELFYLVGALTGLVVGTTPAVARGYLAKIVPKERRAEFFGFNALASRVATLIGPVIFGVVASMYDSRTALLTVVPFLVVGLILLIRQRPNERKNHG